MNPEKIKKKIENNRSLNENQKQLLISGLEAGIEETDIIKNDKIQNTENLSLEFNLTNEKFNLSKKKSTKSVTNSKVQKNLLDINNQTHNNNNNNNNLNSDQTLELKQINYSPSNILNSNNSSDLLNSNNSSNISTSNISETSLKGCTLTTCGHTCLLCHPTLQQLLLICQKSQIISHPDLFSCIKNLLPIVAENGIEKFENYIKEIDNLWLKELILLICCTFGNIEFCQVLLKHNVSFKSSKTNLIQGEPALFFAAGNGKYSMVEWMLKNGSDVNEKKKDSLNTSLHFAAHNGHITVVELLINSGSQINLKNLDQLTPLSCASHSGQLETVKLLVKKGADIYIQDSFEELAIHKAVANDHTSIVEFLLTQDLKKDAKIMKLFGDSLFRKAIYHGNVLVSKILIKFGAEINFKSPKNISPLHLAVFKGNYLCAKLLIEEGANLEMECDSGMTALFFAAVNGHLECTKLLLENGANPNARDCEGKTTLHTVVRKGNLNLTHLLISHNARPDLSDDLGWTPLHEATSENRPDCLKLLLEFLKSKSENSNKFNENFQENGTEKNNSSEKKDTEKNAEEETQSNRQSIQNTFFQEILNKHDKEMCTALHLASRCGNLECLKILVDYGAEIDCVDESLWTPLHEAVNEGYVECVRILLENGARSDAQDIDGNNALHRSAENGYLECAQLIVQYGPLSILYTKNEIGFTPSDLAVLSQSDECVSFLKQKIVEAKDKLEKLALERQEQLLQEEKKQQVEFQKQKQHWKKKEKRLKKKQRDKEKKQRQDRQIEESTTQKMNFLTKDALNIFDEEESNSYCSKKYEEEKNDQKEEFQSDDFFNLQLNQFELNIKNQTQNNNNKNNNNATNINNNKTSNNTNNNNITNNNINKNESKDYLLNQNETIKISNDDNYQNQMNNYQNQMNNYQNQMNNYQNQIQDLNAKLKSLNSNNIILRLQLEAAQQSIINMEKDLEIEKQKNMKFEEKVKTKLLFLEENVTVLEKKANLLQNKKNCILCQKTRREILCLPCLHFIFCKECANNLKINQSECPICKLIINSLLPVKYD